MAKQQLTHDAVKFCTATNDAAIHQQKCILCIGVDITWWGGSRDRASRRECIASAVKSSAGWENPTFTRIDLQGYRAKARDDEPNADPKGEQLVGAINKLLIARITCGEVVIALDAPIKALPRNLPPRNKSQRAGEVERRQCDREWANKVRNSPLGWRNANIQPGAPIPPRVVAIVSLLNRLGFVLYKDPNTRRSEKTLIECFPNEAIWSAGVLGYCDGWSYPNMTTYKRMGKIKAAMPTHLVKEFAHHTLKPCLQAANLPEDNWFGAFWQWISQDENVVRNGKGVAGKCFDDAIDSMISLIVSASFVSRLAHVHVGEDSNDGHIIGPGLFCHLSKPLN